MFDIRNILFKKYLIKKEKMSDLYNDLSVNLSLKFLSNVVYLTFAYLFHDH